MEELAQTVDAIMERGRDSRVVMTTLEAPPYDWVWPEASAAVLAARLAQVEGLEVALSDAVAGLGVAGASWDVALAGTHETVSAGLRFARLRFKAQRVKLSLFERLRLNNTGRESRQQQALDFELSWRKADPAWVFQEGLTLADFRAQRLALRVLEEAQGAAVKEEVLARASLHEAAQALHELCVDWYEAATTTFGPDTVPGALVRTVPTTYDPNRPPGPLVFTRAESPGPGAVALRWRAPRGEKFFLWALAPDGVAWVKWLDGVAGNSWSAENLAAGTWRFKGRAENKFGEGAESAVAAVPVAEEAAA